MSSFNVFTLHNREMSDGIFDFENRQKLNSVYSPINIMYANVPSHILHDTLVVVVHVAGEI